MRLEEGRRIAVVALTAQKRTIEANLIAAGRMDDHPAVQQALAGEPIPDPWANVEGAGVLRMPEPDFIDMGSVPNLA